MSYREKLARFVYGAVRLPQAKLVVGRLKSASEHNALGELLSKLKIDCVIDVGANEGQYARLLRRLRFSGLILSFEPNPEVFQVLQRAFANDSAWRGYNFALGSAEEELAFNVYEQSQISSLLPAGDAVHSKLVRTLKVPVHRLDALLPTILPDWTSRRLFLKCDAQGFDVEVVKGAQGGMTAIHGLQSEIAVQALYRGVPRYLEALAFYESLGFVLVDLRLNERMSNGDALEYDCVMRRSPPTS